MACRIFLLEEVWGRRGADEVRPTEQDAVRNIQSGRLSREGVHVESWKGRGLKNSRFDGEQERVMG